MADVLDFKKVQIVGARTAGASVIKNHWIVWCSKEYCLESNDSIWERRKIFLTEENSGRKRKLSDRYRQTLSRIVWKNYRNIGPKITAELF